MVDKSPPEFISCSACGWLVLCRCLSLCHPLSGSHPRLLRYAAQMFLLHFPCPGELLYPLLPSKAPASMTDQSRDNGVSTILSLPVAGEPALGSPFCPPHTVPEAPARNLTSREPRAYNAPRSAMSTRSGGQSTSGTEDHSPWWGDVPPVALLARPPVSGHMFFATNAWLMVRLQDPQKTHVLPRSSHFVLCSR